MTAGGRSAWTAHVRAEEIRRGALIPELLEEHVTLRGDPRAFGLGTATRCVLPTPRRKKVTNLYLSRMERK